MSIAQAKSRLPLPELMGRLGLGDHAKKSARCPFHEDKQNSFSVWQGESGWRWKCFAECGKGDEIDFIEKHENLSNKDAIQRFIELAGVNGSTPHSTRSHARNAHRSCPPFDWAACALAFTDEHAERLAEWRGYSRSFIGWLRDNKSVGLYDGLIAFPVHDEHCRVIGAHFRLKDGKRWNYEPAGNNAAPLVFGELVTGERVNCFESTWDGLAYMDKSGERDGVIITRGSSNAKLATERAPKNSELYLWTQNDNPGKKWQRDIVEGTKCCVKRVKIPAPHKDLNDWTRAGATDKDLFRATIDAEMLREPERPLIEFRSPLQLKNYTPPPGIILVGDCHIVKGSVFVIGGAPGIGKSRAAVALAVAAATRADWFGLTVHRQFRVTIVQTENGEFRLSREFAQLDCDALENFVRVCPPPPYGLCFGRDEFRDQLKAGIADFAPDVVFYDPWNAAARDEKAREYLETFDALRSVLPIGDEAPALGIVAHTRKPRADERATGRGLLNLLAGSYVLGSVPRTVFVMQAATEETTDNRIVWTCCKNNDGELGARSAWERRNGLFAPVTDFDWDEFDTPEKDRREKITQAHVREVFQNGWLSRLEAEKRLQAITGAERTTCYRALKPDGRFGEHLQFKGERINCK
jgi:CHC2 zinc finger/AAA domain